jgi:dihydrofolate reductase|nr:MAG TPA: DHFR protein [Herelleviridae sp.]
MKIKLIVAFDKKYNIGKDNKLLWNIKEDLQLFKQLTENQIVVMGRNTYDSIGKPLPNRINVVLSNNVEWFGNLEVEDILEGRLRVYGSFNELVNRLRNKTSDKEIFVIGGREMYKQFLRADLVDEMYISHIKGVYDGDIKFPYVDWKNWKVVENKVYDRFTFKKYKKVLDK